MPQGVNAMDVALSLAKINRYTGHSLSPYSVAQHSLGVSVLLDHDPVLALYGLVHDVAETVTQDISYPVKQALGPEGLAPFKRIEHAAEQAIFKVLGIHWPMPPWIAAAVKKQDWVMAATEKRDVMPPCDRSWGMLVEPPSFARILPVQDWLHIAKCWHKRYETLHRICQQIPLNRQQALPQYPLGDGDGA
jgi:hypothetical protein